MMIVIVLLSILQLSLADTVDYPPCGSFSDDPPFDSRPLPESYDVQEIKWIFYNGNDEAEVEINNGGIDIPGFYDPSLPTKVLIHGWNSNRNTLAEMKDAYLATSNVNVVIVDWQVGAGRVNYALSASNTQVVGACTAFVAQEMGGSDFHCSGHSLGAHTCGYMGKGTNLGRLTAMDPAGPLFEGFDEEVRVDRSDADFVDVLHTQAPQDPTVDSLGMRIDIGHVDFYPYNGDRQPGCTAQLCDHNRAFEYMAVSITEPNCYASCPCPSGDAADNDECNSCAIGDRQYMGEPADSSGGQGTFFLEPSYPGC